MGEGMGWMGQTNNLLSWMGELLDGSGGSDE